MQHYYVLGSVFQQAAWTMASCTFKLLDEASNLQIHYHKMKLLAWEQRSVG